MSSQARMLKHRDKVALQVRRIVAEVHAWSVAGAHDKRALNQPSRRPVLMLRIHEELGVMVPDMAWPELVDVGRLIAFVHLEIAREYAAAY